MAKQTVTAFFAERQHASDAVLLLRRSGIRDRNVTVSPAAAASSAASEVSAPAQGFWTWLEALFGDTDHHSVYADGIRRGTVMVSVYADTDRLAAVVAMLERSGCAELQVHETTWTPEGWTESSSDIGNTGVPSRAAKTSTTLAEAAAGVLSTASAGDAYRASAGRIAATPARRDDAIQGAGAPPVQRADGKEVVGADGQHLGFIDRVEGTTILLKHGDAAGSGPQHMIPTAWVHTIDDDRVVLKLTAADVLRRRDRSGVALSS